MRFVDLISAITGASSAIFLALAVVVMGNVAWAAEPLTENCSDNTCNCPDDCKTCGGGGQCHCVLGECLVGQ